MTNLDYLYNKNAAKDIFSKNHFIDKKLHFKIIERGTILPHKNTFVNGQWTWGFGGIVDERNEFVKNSFVNSGAGEAYTPTENIQYFPATVVYLGLFFPVWGHCLTDNIRRLWFLKSEIFWRYFKNCSLVYIPWGGAENFFEQQRNFKRLLDILEIDTNEIIPIYHPVQFENIILPDESFYVEDGEKKFTDEYRETIERVKNFALKHKTATSNKKIYFYYGRVQIGEERLAEYFRLKGYEVISPEKLTVDEQLNLLINAESFASTLGSCAHNSIFLREGTECIFIPRAANRFTDYQASLNQLNNLNAFYIDSSLSIFFRRNRLYCFIISKQLKEFFGDKFDSYDEEDLRIFLGYLKFALDKGISINPDSEGYYGEVLGKFLIQLSQHEDLMDTYGVKL